MEGIESDDKSVVVPVSLVSVSSGFALLLSSVSELSVSVSSVLPVVVSSGASYAGVVSSKRVSEQSLERWLSGVFVVERKFRQSSMVKECIVKERVCFSEKMVDRVVKKFGSGMIPSEVWGCMTYFEKERVKERGARRVWE